MIGSLSGGNDANVTIESSYVKGKITGSSNNEVGGTIAVTNGSTITIDHLDINGLSIMSGGTNAEASSVMNGLHQRLYLQQAKVLR